MSSDGTAEAAGRQDGLLERFLALEEGFDDHWITHPANAKAIADFKDALAAFRGDSPALGPSSPPPPSREEQIKEAAEKAVEALLRHDDGTIAVGLSPRFEDEGTVLWYMPPKLLRDRIASVLRSCWPSAAEGDGGEHEPRAASWNGLTAGDVAEIHRFLDHEGVPPCPTGTTCNSPRCTTKLSHRMHLLIAERDAYKATGAELAASNSALSEALAAARKSQAAAERERDQAVAEGNRRDAKWKAGINEACGVPIDFDPGADSNALCLQHFVSNCKRERDEAKADAAAWKRDCEMYQKAWKRELAGFIGGNYHLIDALVTGTQDLVARCKKAEAECAALRARPASLPPKERPDREGWWVVRRGERKYVWEAVAVAMWQGELWHSTKESQRVSEVVKPGDQWYCLDDLFAPSPPASPADALCHTFDAFPASPAPSEVQAR